MGLKLDVAEIMAAAALLFLCVLQTGEGGGHGMEEEISHLHFYFHDTWVGKNVSAVQVASAPSTKSSPTLFGAVVVIDDWLTEEPDATSKLLGRAQGLYASAGQEEAHMLMVLTFVFESGKYNGSTLALLGNNEVQNQVREMPIVGGSGLFRLARGYALAHTHYYDPSNGNAIVEYNVTVLHL